MATTYVRGKVSKKKRRFVDKKNGFDLDLSYVCNNIIAMGFPSEGAEGLYRNPYQEVLRFLDLRHKDHYKVYNLCSERHYEPAKFYDRVGKFAFDDHNAPRFGLMEEFCADVKAFLDESDENVAVIHCKAGKGRTGVMISCWLLYNREWDNAEDAMQYYAAMRTHNQKGVTIPSQRRYVNYFGRYMNEGMPDPTTLYIKTFRLHGVPKLKKDGELRCNVIMDKRIVWSGEVNKKDYKEGIKTQKKSNDELTLLEIACTDDEKHPQGIPVLADVKVEFYEKAFRYQETMFTFWFNTGFIEECHLQMEQHELDTALKDRSNKIYPKGFQVSVDFEPHESSAVKAASAQADAPAAESAASASGSAGKSSSAKKKKKKTRSKKQRSEVLEEYPSLKNL